MCTRIGDCKFQLNPHPRLVVKQSNTPHSLVTIIVDGSLSKISKNRFLIHFYLLKLN